VGFQGRFYLFEGLSKTPKTLKAPHTAAPRVINVDKNAAYPKAMRLLKQRRQVPKTCQLRQVKYLNNMVEQDHRALKRVVKPGLGFGSFATADRTLAGYEAMHMLRKGQVRSAPRGDIRAQVRFIENAFGIAA
jgi:IS6 family transposase